MRTRTSALPFTLLPALPSIVCVIPGSVARVTLLVYAARPLVLFDFRMPLRRSLLALSRRSGRHLACSCGRRAHAWTVATGRGYCRHGRLRPLGGALFRDVIAARARLNVLSVYLFVGELRCCLRAHEPRNGRLEEPYVVAFGEVGLVVRATT